MADVSKTTDQCAEIVGYKTFCNEDGTHRHEPIRRDEAEELLAHCDAAKAKRAADMPTEKDALNAMHEAYTRLCELGWREAIYCPKDGTWFQAIEAGSTGVFQCQYSGEWPNGSWWIADADDLWPAHPILHKLSPEDEAARAARMAAAAAKYKLENEHAG
jgi:hypothetical protein